MELEMFANLIEQDTDKAIAEAIKLFQKMEVLVGIPEEEGSRLDSGVLTNVELLYIHTNGSPLQNIPARPVIEPAVQDASERIAPILAQAFESALNGDKEGVMANLNRAGLVGQQAAQGWFTNPQNAWEPNAESTARAKRRKGSTNPRPLINTGELRKSIIYVVRET